jgi:hypothetical protein
LNTLLPLGNTLPFIFPNIDSPVSIPKLVTLGCAAVVNTPVIKLATATFPKLAFPDVIFAETLMLPVLVFPATVSPFNVPKLLI